MTKENTVLVVDGGGRGAALVDKYAQSDHVARVLAVPGNDLMGVTIFPKLKTTDTSEIVKICEEGKVSLVDVSQEDAIAAGLVDALKLKRIPVVGPSKNAGQIESSKAFSREFGTRINLPQPGYKIFNFSEPAINWLQRQKEKAWFVKASGLAQGKGAMPAENNAIAIEMVSQMKKFGMAGKEFVIEEWMRGEEFSAFVISDGNRYQLIGYAQDHKRENDYDCGRNTGGMGCVSNPLVVTKRISRDVNQYIVEPTIAGMRREHRSYKGVLYVGCIVSGNKVKVMEFNGRWGDPEAQVIVPGLQNDLFELGMAISRGDISKIKIQTDDKVRVSVVGAARGYPGNYEDVRGKRIYGLEEVRKIDGVRVYGAGVKIIDGKCYANGGRLFHIVGEGETVVDAREKAYEALARIYIEGNNLHFRTDIGFRDVERIYGHTGN